MEEIETIEALKEELRQTRLAYQMAREMVQFKGGFLARTSHELRSPLSSLMGLHQLILSDLCESPQEEREFVAQAYKYAQKLLKIIDEIVFVSKLQAGTAELDIRSWQLREILEELYVCTHLQAANRNIHLEFEYPDGNLYIFTDLQRILQVLVNLIEIAIKHSELGTIRLSTNLEQDYLEIYLDLPANSQFWSEQVNSLEEIADLGAISEISQGMRLLLSQSLLETMGGGLEICQLPNNTEEQLMRITALFKSIHYPQIG
jgi:signal transduction histidine kinase